MTADAVTPPAAAYTFEPDLTRDGKALERTVDQIEELNRLKAANTAPTADGHLVIYRQYATARPEVKDFYKEQHTKQTVAFNIAAREHFHSPSRVRQEMAVWEAMERLNTLIDDSDPDTNLSQIQHLLQSAEAIRRDGKPRWMQLTGLVHDLGKMLFFDGAQGQWDVVGDTFPVGCAYHPTIVMSTDEAPFTSNPDWGHPVYSTRLGIYEEKCGIDNLMMSWGHDEYLYLVLKGQCTLPQAALDMIRYHSFYPWHSGASKNDSNSKDNSSNNNNNNNNTGSEGPTTTEQAAPVVVVANTTAETNNAEGGAVVTTPTTEKEATGKANGEEGKLKKERILAPHAYEYFMKEGDLDKLKAVQAFNPYDLYSKNPNPPNVEELKPYYLELIDEFFPKKVIKW